MKFLSEILTDGDVLSHSLKTTVATTSTTTIATIDGTKYRTIELLIQLTQGTSHHSTKVFVLHDGTDTWLTEYAVLTSDGALTSITATLSGSNVLIQTTQGSATSAAYKIYIVATPV